ncbi:MAG: alpha/beta fold hydrolase, partial [Hyphomicrobiaceae bacterium]
MTGNVSKRTFVLVHGAWHGGWCWSGVADGLRAAGHRVFAPTLTGLADRSHLMSRSIDLDTHIADVANLFEWEDVEDAVLVGHSYGGWVVSGAIEKVLPRVSSMVYLDAFVPDSGQRSYDLTHGGNRRGLDVALANGAVSRPSPGAAAVGLTDPAVFAGV